MHREQSQGYVCHTVKITKACRICEECAQPLVGKQKSLNFFYIPLVVDGNPSITKCYILFSHYAVLLGLVGGFITLSLGKTHREIHSF